MKNQTARELKLSEGSFDKENTFNVKTDKRTVTASLCKDYDVVGDGIYWGMNSGVSLKSSYTEKDNAEMSRLAQEKPIESGDEVEINGELYVARVLGAYSDCVIFDKL